jgi:hypothetical protein
MEIADIESVVQWGGPDGFCALYQRYGRGACDKTLNAVAVLLAETERMLVVDPKRERERANSWGIMEKRGGSLGCIAIKQLRPESEGRRKVVRGSGLLSAYGVIFPLS